MREKRDRTEYRVDELNLRIIEGLLRNPEASAKNQAEALGVDERTVGTRVRKMKENGVIRGSVEIDWQKLGIRASAYVGTTTARGEKYVALLRQFIKTDPRIVEAYETIGSHQYFFRVLETDLSKLRDSVLRDLEPLTAELSTTLVSSELKKRDYIALLRYLRETRYPRSRAPPHEPTK